MQRSPGKTVLFYFPENGDADDARVRAQTKQVALRGIVSLTCTKLRSVVSRRVRILGMGEIARGGRECWGQSWGAV